MISWQLLLVSSVYFTIFITRLNLAGNLLDRSYKHTKFESVWQQQMVRGGISLIKNRIFKLCHLQQLCRKTNKQM